LENRKKAEIEKDQKERPREKTSKKKKKGE